MTLPIARDLMGENIRVNTILPGIFDTPLLPGAPQPVKRRARRLGALPEAPRASAGEYANLALCMIETAISTARMSASTARIRMAPR
jgi:NAD(P)-dependent dehydrogenase (short-subunit alcohol dehydrogenase family)